MKETASDSISKSILQTMLYFDIFNYPLKSTEVYHFLQSNHVTPELIQEKLQQLSNHGVAYRFDHFYSLQNDAALVNRRIQGNAQAKNYMDIAIKQALLIQRFPFVKSVMISGSLSKGYMDDSCDLDFFIVTQHQRLWIARTLLVLYKRIFLSNSHKLFCVNYFIDDNNLEIEEKNLYAATEIVTLIPLTGVEYHQKLLSANKWVIDYLPNAKHDIVATHTDTPKSKLKDVLEITLNLIFPRFFNSIFMKLTLRRWKKLYSKIYSKEDFNVAFKTKTDVSKNHPNYYQKKVMDIYSTKVKRFAIDNNLSWKS